MKRLAGTQKTPTHLCAYPRRGGECEQRCSYAGILDEVAVEDEREEDGGCCAWEAGDGWGEVSWGVVYWRAMLEDVWQEASAMTPITIHRMAI
jgi:hypothetical protein